MIPPIVFWQNELSIHQESLLREIGNINVNPVWVVTNKGMPERRKSQGWEDINYGSVQIKITRSLTERKEFIEHIGPEAIHIMSGLGREKTLSKTQHILIKRKSRIGFYLEPWNESNTFRQYMLRGFYIWKTRGIKGREHFLLTTSELGIRQLQKIGFAREQIFSFGYFLNSPQSISSNTKTVQHAPKDGVKILFVGGLSLRKQALILAQTATEQYDDNFKLTIVGDGGNKKEIVALAEQYPNRIEYLGALSNDETRLLMRSSDFLILPSLFDGWGAVLSESISEGTPVLASSACGASQIVVTASQGFVFDPGVHGIRKAFEHAVRRGQQSHDDRIKLQKWAEVRLSGIAGARYLIRIIRHQLGQDNIRPVAPWKIFESSDWMP